MGFFEPHELKSKGRATSFLSRLKKNRTVIGCWLRESHLPHLWINVQFGREIKRCMHIHPIWESSHIWRNTTMTQFIPWKSNNISVDPYTPSSNTSSLLLLPFGLYIDVTSHYFWSYRSSTITETEKLPIHRSHLHMAFVANNEDPLGRANGI